MCCKEESVLSPFWIYFLDLLFVAFVIIIILNTLPQRILPLYLTVNQSAFVQNPVYL